MGRLHPLQRVRLTVTSILWIEYENSPVGEIETFQFRHVRAALSDWQVRVDLAVIRLVLMFVCFRFGRTR